MMKETPSTTVFLLTIRQCNLKKIYIKGKAKSKVKTGGEGATCNIDDK